VLLQRANFFEESRKIQIDTAPLVTAQMRTATQTQLKARQKDA